MPNTPNAPENRDPRHSGNPENLREFEEATDEVAREGKEHSGGQAPSAEHRAKRRKLEELENFEDLTEEPAWENDKDSRSG